MIVQDVPGLGLFRLNGRVRPAVLVMTEGNAGSVRGLVFFGLQIHSLLCDITAAARRSWVPPLGGEVGAYAAERYSAPAAPR